MVDDQVSSRGYTREALTIQPGGDVCLAIIKEAPQFDKVGKTPVKKPAGASAISIVKCTLPTCAERHLVHQPT